MDNFQENKLPLQSENDLMQILNSKPVETLIKAFSDVLKQNSENEQKRLEIEKKRLEFQEKELELESKEIELEQDKLKTFVKLDLTTKLYATFGVIAASVIIYGFAVSNIMNKNSAETLVTLLISLLITGGTSVLKSFLDKKNT